jgi:hypothetical protein
MRGIKDVKVGATGFLVAIIEVVFTFFFLRTDPDPFHSGFVYSQALAVKDGLLPAKDFISPYGVISPFLNGLWTKFVNDSLFSLLLLYGAITISSGILIQLFITRMGYFKLGVLLNLVWVMTLATAMPWPSILTTFFTLLGLYILYFNSEMLSLDYKGSYLRIIPVVILLQFSVLTRIHLLITPMVISIFTFFYRRSINTKFFQYWFISNLVISAILLALLDFLGILGPFVDQVILWPLTSFESPPINISFVFSFIWFPVSLLLVIALTSILSKLNANSTSPRRQAFLYLFCAVFFYSIYRISIFNFKNGATNTLKSIPGFLKQSAVYSQFWPILAAATISVTALLYKIFLYFKGRLVSNLPNVFQEWLMSALVITGLVQLFPLHDNIHLWFVGPLFIVPAVHFLSLHTRVISTYDKSIHLILISFLTVQILSTGTHLSSTRVPLSSPELTGMMATPEYKKTTDKTMVLLSKYVSGRELRNNCAASLYSVSNRTYRSVDGNFSEGFFSNLTSFTPVVNPAKIPASEIFECGISESNIKRRDDLGYKVLFKVIYPKRSPSGEKIYNVLFEKK